MDFLQRHPFPVRAHFDRAVAFSFAFPKEILGGLLPEGLELDTYESFGFLTVALVWTRHLRMAGLPKQLGQDFLLAGYRIFVRMTEPGGRKLRGLKIIRSETDKKRMATIGNLVTGYRYCHVKAVTEQTDGVTRARTFEPSGKKNIDFHFRRDDSASLPSGSPFKDWHAARLFAGPMPFTFSHQSSNGSFVVVEGQRTNWMPRPVEVLSWSVALFDDEPFRNAKPVLANAFTVEKVDYYWKRGRIVRPLTTFS